MMYNPRASDHRNRTKHPDNRYGNSSYQPPYNQNQAFRMQASSHHQPHNVQEFLSSQNCYTNYGYPEFHSQNPNGYWNKQYLPSNNQFSYYQGNQGYNRQQYENHGPNLYGNAPLNTYGVQSYTLNRSSNDQMPIYKEKSSSNRRQSSESDWNMSDRPSNYQGKVEKQPSKAPANLRPKNKDKYKWGNPRMNNDDDQNNDIRANYRSKNFNQYGNIVPSRKNCTQYSNEIQWNDNNDDQNVDNIRQTRNYDKNFEQNSKRHQWHNLKGERNTDYNYRKESEERTDGCNVEKAESFDEQPQLSELDDMINRYKENQDNDEQNVDNIRQTSYFGKNFEQNSIRNQWHNLKGERNTDSNYRKESEDRTDSDNVKNYESIYVEPQLSELDDEINRLSQILNQEQSDNPEIKQEIKKYKQEETNDIEDDDDFEDISDDEYYLDEIDKELDDWSDWGESEDVSEKKRQCGNTYYNSNIKEELTKPEITIKQECKQETKMEDELMENYKMPPGKSLKLNNTIKLLSDKFLLKYLKKILDFLSDENAKDIVFDEVTNIHQKTFLISIKSKKVLACLSPDCALYYSNIRKIFEHCRMSWVIGWKKINGIKMVQYTKKPPKKPEQRQTMKNIIQEIKTGMNTGSMHSGYKHVANNFKMDILKRTLKFVEDDQQARLVFSDVSEKHQLKFILMLRRKNIVNALDRECSNIYKKISSVIQSKNGLWKWTVACKNFKCGKILEYQKTPYNDNGSVKSDNSEGRGSRFRRRSRGKNKPSNDKPNKKDKKISFLPQSSKASDGEEEVKVQRTLSAPRVNKEKAGILEGLAKPVVASKAERMMMMMGWKGGALGSKGDGIMEPIAPNLNQMCGAGLGHVREEKSRSRAPKKMDDFEIGVWTPVKPVKNTKPAKPKQPEQMMKFNSKKQKQQQMPKKLRKQAARDAVKTMALKQLLQFVLDDRELKLSFAMRLTPGQRKIVHVIVAAFHDGSDPELDSEEQIELFIKIQEMMNCVLYTESSGDKAKGTRQIYIYKTVAEDTYLVTPEDLEDVVEPAEFIDSDDKDDCYIVEPESEQNEQKGNSGQAASHPGLSGINIGETRNDIREKRNNFDETSNDVSESKHNITHAGELRNDSCETRNDLGDVRNDVGETPNDLILTEHMDITNTERVNNLESDEEIDPELTFNAYNPENTNKFSIKLERDGDISGISIENFKYIERKPVLECPENSKCRMFQLCRQYVPKEDSSSGSSFKWNNDNENDSSSNESVEIVSTKRIRKRPYSKINPDSKDVTLIENKLKNIGIPRRENESLTKQEKLTKLLVTYLAEFYDDSEYTTLRFLGDFKVVDRIIINRFMSDLWHCLAEKSIEKLRNNFMRDEESYVSLKRILLEGSEKISVERTDEGPFSTYTVYKIK